MAALRESQKGPIKKPIRANDGSALQNFSISLDQTKPAMYYGSFGRNYPGIYQANGRKETI